MGTMLLNWDHCHALQHSPSLRYKLIGWTELEAFQTPRGKCDSKNFHRDFDPLGRNILSLYLIWGLTGAKCHVWFCAVETVICAGESWERASSPVTRKVSFREMAEPCSPRFPPGAPVNLPF